MSKKKFRKGKKGWFFSAIGAIVRGAGWFLWKLVPVAILAGLLVYGGFAVKKILTEDRWLRWRPCASATARV